jgi:arylsulfatase A-like enzyme
MVMRWPGRIQAGSECRQLVQLHDLAHTFTDLTGASALPHRHGISLKPLLDDPNRSGWRDMIQFPWFGQNFLMNHWTTVTDRHKYVFNSFDFDECYDLREDPDEMRNLVNDTGNAAVVADMQARTYELMDKHGDPFGAASNSSARFHAQRYLSKGRRTPKQ